MVNLTAADQTQGTYLTVWPDGAAKPPTSDVNASSSGPPIANNVAVRLLVDGELDIFNDLGSTDVIVDSQGYFTACSGGYNGYGYTGYSDCGA